MAETLVERIWAWLHATFPERQIYIRSDGRVQFFTFGATLQATLSGLALIFLGWVAFATVNVIFKDRIIATKDHRYQQMQSVYENRVADLQLNYDELNGALVAAEDRFKATADELEAKQNTVSRLLGRKQAVDAIISGMNGNGTAAAVKSQDADAIPAARGSGMSSDSVGNDAPHADIDTGSGGASQLGVMPQTVEPQPRTSRPTKASFLDEAVSRFAAVFLSGRERTAQRPLPNQPALQVLALQTERLARMSSNETALLIGVDHEVGTRIADLQTILHRVGVNANSLEQQSSEGVGGPYVPI